MNQINTYHAKKPSRFLKMLRQKREYAGKSKAYYSPFGSPMPGRTANEEKYRYGMNGQEMDNEIDGNGNNMTAEFWEYDARIGRRFNVDPIDFVEQSLYATFNNDPIVYADMDGLEADGGEGGGDGGEGGGDGGEGGGDPKTPSEKAPDKKTQDYINKYNKDHEKSGSKWRAKYNNKTGGVTEYEVEGTNGTSSDSDANPTGKTGTDISPTPQPTTPKEVPKGGEEQRRKTSPHSDPENDKVFRGAEPSIGAQGINFWRDANIRLNYYQPRVDNFTQLHKAGQISDGTYSMLRYQAQKASKMQMSKMGRVLSENAPLGKPLAEQKALAESVAKGKTPLPKGAHNTRSLTTEVTKASKIAGKALVVTAAAMSAYHVIKAKDKVKALTQEVGGWAGAMAGAEGGAVVGTMLGGPVGAVIGGFVGGWIGYLGGYEFGTASYEAATEK